MHQKHGSQISHPISGEKVTVTPVPYIVIDKEVVEIPPITPRSETVETIPKEPISELGNAATAQAAAIAQPQAGPRYPTRQRKAPQRLSKFGFLIIRTIKVIILYTFRISVGECSVYSY